MGIGLVLAARADDAERLLQNLAALGERGAAIIGRIVSGDRAVRYI